MQSSATPAYLPHLNASCPSCLCSKRPSIHLKGGSPSVSHTLQVAQFWELMIDARLLSSFTPLSKMSQLLAVARRPPQALRDFQQQVRFGAMWRCFQMALKIRMH